MEYGETFEEMMDRQEREEREREARDPSVDSASARRRSAANRFSVVMHTMEGASAEFTMCDRSKNSVVLRNTIECFADYEPPWDSDQTTQLFEDALVNLTRDEGEGRAAGVAAFRARFSAGPRIRNTRSRYLIVGDEPSDATLIHLVDVDVEAPLERVKAVVWDELVERESKGDGAEATRLHRIADDEVIYRVARTPPRGSRPEELVCHARLVERYHPVDRFVVMAYSVDCAAAPEDAAFQRLTVPLTGFVLDAADRDGKATRLTWVCEQALVVGTERAIMKANALKVSDIQERVSPGATLGIRDDSPSPPNAGGGATVTPLDATKAVDVDDGVEDDRIHDRSEAHAAFCCSFDSNWAKFFFGSTFN